MKAPHKDLANALRFLAADAIQNANSGHPGLPMGMADVATVLFTRLLRFDSEAPDWPDRDRFVLSAGHGSMLLYGLLHLTGYESVSIEDIKRFRQLGSPTPGHPEHELPGVETTTGPLGQGVGNAVGMALAERLLNARFGDDLVDHTTWVLAGDGCLMEGVGQEAVTLAGHLGLEKLVLIFDDNRICIDGPTSLATSEDHLARFEAAGWDVRAVDGHDPDAVAAALEAARDVKKPAMVACRTVIGYGAPTLAGTEKTHGSPLGAEEIAGAREKLGWPHPAFVVPDEVLATWRAAGTRGRAEREAWEARLGAADPGTGAALQRALSGELPEAWRGDLEALKAELLEAPAALATRRSSGKVLETLTASIPELVGGSADLTGSVKTRTAHLDPAVGPGRYEGRFIHYGVREHAMGALMNGMALHGGVIPFGGTFLVFADYLRPSIRMAAMMGLKVVYVFTHDSIGLGEDGPTHQPIETLASLRIVPGLKVFRPADSVETAECWELAVAGDEGPSVLALTRQSVPAVCEAPRKGNPCARGGYVLAEASAERRVTLIATGSEAGVALEARAMLEAEGVPTAVVSMPCSELFERQDAAYRASVLGPGTARVAVEAGVEGGWRRYLGDDGAFVGMSTFGASAPAKELFEHFGITPAAVAAAAKLLLRS